MGGVGGGRVFNVHRMAFPSGSYTSCRSRHIALDIQGDPKSVSSRDNQRFDRRPLRLHEHADDVLTGLNLYRQLVLK